MSVADRGPAAATPPAWNGYHGRIMLGPLGFWELIFILGLALIVFGPRKLPEVGRTLGKTMGEFRRATTDLKRTIDREIKSIDDEQKSSLSAPRPAARTTTPASSTSSPSATSTEQSSAPVAESKASDGDEARTPALDANAVPPSAPDPRPSSLDSSEEAAPAAGRP